MGVRRDTTGAHTRKENSHIGCEGASARRRPRLQSVTSVVRGTESNAMRRALRRAADGRALDVTEAAVLLTARGQALDELLAIAGAVRDAGLADAGRPGVVTYSRKVFIPLTRLCRDRCHYCTFATVPHRLPSAVPGDRTRSSRSPAQAPRRAARRPCSRSATGRRTGGSRRALARRARLRLDPGLSAGVRDRGAGGDRPAAAPQPRRAVVGGPAAAEAGRAEHGHDAGDHRDPAVVEPGGAALRLAGQGARGPPAGARGRRPGRGAVHDRHPDRHRRDDRGARRVPVRDPARRPASSATSRRSSSRTSAPSRTRRCAACPTRSCTSWRRRSRWRGWCSVRRPASRPRPTSSTTSTACCCGPASTTGAASRRSPPTTSTRSGPGRRSTIWRAQSRQPGSCCGSGSRSIPSTCGAACPGWTPGSRHTSQR